MKPRSDLVKFGIALAVTCVALRALGNALPTHLSCGVIARRLLDEMLCGGALGVALSLAALVAIAAIPAALRFARYVLAALKSHAPDNGLIVEAMVSFGVDRRITAVCPECESTLRVFSGKDRRAHLIVRVLCPCGNIHGIFDFGKPPANGEEPPPT